MATRTARTAPPTWTEDRIRACGVRMDGLQACEAVLGLRRTRAYELLAAAAAGDPDAVPFPVIVVRGKGGQRARYVVATASVLKVLDLADDPAPVR